MQSRKALYRLSYLPALALCGAFLSTINPFSKELSMVKKTTSKFIIAFFSLSFLGLTLWHCKKDNSPTAPRTSPDLIVSISPSSPNVMPSQMITLTATVSNVGDGNSTATTLRWYRSADTSLDTNADTEIGTSTVTNLAAGTSIAISNTITASNAPGTYYYFACIDGVTGEIQIANNCSAALEVVVIAPELMVTLNPRSANNVAPSASITLSALVSNVGDANSPTTTLRWYRSADNSLDRNVDTEIGTSAVSSLGAGRGIAISKLITASNTPGTYYYFACVDPVTNESDPANNCSDAREVVVTVPDLVAP